MLHAEAVGLHHWHGVDRVDGNDVLRAIGADAAAAWIVKRRVEDTDDIREGRIPDQAVNVVTFHPVIADAVTTPQHSPSFAGQIVSETETGPELPGVILRQASRQPVLDAGDPIQQVTGTLCERNVGKDGRRAPRVVTVGPENRQAVVLLVNMRDIEVAEAKIQSQARACLPVVLKEKFHLVIVVARLPIDVQFAIARRLSQKKVGMRVVREASAETERPLNGRTCLGLNRRARKLILTAELEGVPPGRSRRDVVDGPGIRGTRRRGGQIRDFLRPALRQRKDLLDTQPLGRSEIALQVDGVLFPCPIVVGVIEREFRQDRRVNDLRELPDDVFGRDVQSAGNGRKSLPSPERSRLALEPGLIDETKHDLRLLGEVMIYAYELLAPVFRNREVLQEVEEAGGFDRAVGQGARVQSGARRGARRIGEAVRTREAVGQARGSL